MNIQFRKAHDGSWTVQVPWNTKAQLQLKYKRPNLEGFEVEVVKKNGEVVLVELSDCVGGDNQFGAVYQFKRVEYDCDDSDYDTWEFYEEFR
jgi:hypothetical protein